MALLFLGGVNDIIGWLFYNVEHIAVDLTTQRRQPKFVLASVYVHSNWTLLSLLNTDPLEKLMHLDSHWIIISVTRNPSKSQFDIGSTAFFL